jgi:alpha-N-acetylglucosamine transferase
MSIKQIIFFIGAISYSLLSFYGCGTFQMQTNVKMTQDINISPIKKKIIFINIKNSSKQKLYLLKNLKINLEKQGYTIVNHKNNASLILNINILFANNLKEAYALKASAGIGVVTGNNYVRNGDGKSLLVGATIALTGIIINSIAEDEIYRAVIDISILKNHKKYDSRILAEAKATNLKLSEALPILSSKVSNKISQIFK